MRTTSLVLLSLASASTLVSAKADGRNSLETLLDRIQHSKTGTSPSPDNTAKSPAVVDDEDDVEPAAPTVEKKDSLEGEVAPTDKMVKRNRTKKREQNAKRWADLVLQYDPLAVVAKSRTSLTTPAARPSPSAASVSKRMTTTPPAARHTPAEKRWIWANSVIQDDTPASEVPPVGENINQLSQPAVTLSTPDAVPAAPTFSAVATSSVIDPPAAPTSLDAAGAAVAAPEAATTSSSSPNPAPTSSALSWWDPTEFFHDVEAGFEKLFGLDHDDDESTSAATAAPTVATAEVEKRWVWATGIIQDVTPNAPPVGGNYNMFGSQVVPVNTPSLSLALPSFAPRPPAPHAPGGVFSAPANHVIAAAPPPAASSVGDGHDVNMPSVAAQQTVVGAASSVVVPVPAPATASRLSQAQRIAAARARHAAPATARMAKVKRGGHA
ncbi:hypothetical protein JCM9279_002736 [Rhodotorula babjevae]